MGDYSEISALNRLSDSVTVEQYGCGRFPKGKPSDEDIALARKGLGRIKEVFSSGQYDVVILDEANVAVSCELFGVEALVEIMDLKPADVELIITGRNAPAAVIEKADLVSQVQAVKHYFQKGVKARIGIEK
jgi:cob(I)alamin adenosyltransferase